MKDFKENHLASAVEAIEDLAEAIRSQPQPPAPVVNVEAASPVVVPAAKVDVTPQINIPPQPKSWTFEVVERDGTGRIKKFTATSR